MKKQFLRTLFLAIVTIVLTGCGEYSKLTLDTFPTGAQLIDIKSGKQLGIAPMQTDISYDSITENESIKCKDFGNVKAVWVSGATAILEKSFVCRQPVNTFIINRPEYPNIETDISYAKMVLQNKNSIQMAEYAKQQADAADYANFNQSMQNLNNNTNQQMQNIQLMQLNNSIQMNNTLRYMGK